MREGETFETTTPMILSMDPERDRWKGFLQWTRWAHQITKTT